MYLSWSETPAGSVGVWRGTFPGSFRLLAVLPPGQAGFLDLSARKTEGYLYALGDGRRPGEADRLALPGAAAGVRVLPGLVTTCSGLVPGSPFPANTQNVFVASKHPNVQYYGYFLLRPYDPAARDVKLVWRDAAGQVFSEIAQAVVPKAIDLTDGRAGQLLLTQAVGLQHAYPQTGQQRVPDRPGLCTVEAFVDGVPAALTVFYLREEPSPSRPRPDGAATR